MSSDFLKIWFSWGAELSDLDILAYWNGIGDYQSRGWNNAKGPMEYSDGTATYMLAWSGDVQGAEASEWLGSRGVVGKTLKIHLNFYHPVADGVTPECTVRMKYIPTGNEVSLESVECAKNKNTRATVDDPVVEITFTQKSEGVVARITHETRYVELNLY